MMISKSKRIFNSHLVELTQKLYALVLTNLQE